ncbi:MAG: hypothetical protein Q4F43_10220 [Eubacteriales bacterium]|nr:hypothetical protein [Eubacteriales bacterium]
MSVVSEKKIRAMQKRHVIHKKMLGILKASMFLFPIMIQTMGDKSCSEDPESFIAGVCMTLAIGGIGLLSFSGAVLTNSVDHDEGLLRDLLAECQGEDFKVLAYDHDLEIPMPVILKTGLMDPYTFSFGQDYLALRHRGFRVVCSRLMLLERVRNVLDKDGGLQAGPGTETVSSQGSKTGDGMAEKTSEEDFLSWVKSIRNQGYSITGRSYQELSENEKTEGLEDAVRFDGTVLLFLPGPDLDGSISIEVRDNEKYTAYLWKNAAELLESFSGRSTNPGTELEAAGVSELFYRYHYVHGESAEDPKEQLSEDSLESAVTPGVMKMILHAESFAQAPVELHASREMVCVTVQRRLYQLSEILRYGNDAKRAGRKFKEEIARFRCFLDILTGEPDGPVFELFSREDRQETTALGPFLLPVQENRIPSGQEIREYTETVITSAWMYYEELYSAFIHRNPQIYRERMCRFLQEDIFMSTDLSAVEDAESLLDAMTEIYTQELLIFCCTPCKYEIDEIRVKDASPAERADTDQKGTAEEVNDRGKGLRPGEIEVCVAIHPPVMEWDLHWNAAAVLRRFGGSAKRLRKLLCAKEQQPEFLELFALALQKQRWDGIHSGETCRRTLQLNRMENLVYGAPRDRLDLFVNQVFCSAFSCMKINGKPMLIQNEKWL